NSFNKSSCVIALALTPLLFKSDSRITAMLSLTFFIDTVCWLPDNLLIRIDVHQFAWLYLSDWLLNFYKQHRGIAISERKNYKAMPWLPQKGCFWYLMQNFWQYQTLLLHFYRQ